MPSSVASATDLRHRGTHRRHTHQVSTTGAADCPDDVRYRESLQSAIPSDQQAVDDCPIAEPAPAHSVAIRPPRGIRPLEGGCAASRSPIVCVGTVAQRVVEISAGDQDLLQGGPGVAVDVAELAGDGAEHVALGPVSPRTLFSWCSKVFTHCSTPCAVPAH